MLNNKINHEDTCRFVITCCGYSKDNKYLQHTFYTQERSMDTAWTKANIQLEIEETLRIFKNNEIEQIVFFVIDQKTNTYDTFIDVNTLIESICN